MNYNYSIATISAKEGGAIMFHTILKYFSPLFDKVSYYVDTLIGIVRVIGKSICKLKKIPNPIYLYSRALVFPPFITALLLSITYFVPYYLLPEDIITFFLTTLVSDSSDCIIIILAYFILLTFLFIFVYAVDHLSILIEFGKEGYKLYKDVQSILSDFFMPVLTLTSIFTLFYGDSRMYNFLLLSSTLVIHITVLFQRVYSKQNRLHEYIDSRYEIYLTNKRKKHNA